MNSLFTSRPQRVDKEHVQKAQMKFLAKFKPLGTLSTKAILFLDLTNFFSDLISSSKYSRIFSSEKCIFKFCAIDPDQKDFKKEQICFLG